LVQTRSLAQNVRIDEVLCLPHRIDVQGGDGGAGRGDGSRFSSFDAGQYRVTFWSPLNENVDSDIPRVAFGDESKLRMLIWI
jgi:hypothetical protein